MNNHDFYNITINVLRRPKLNQSIDKETGELMINVKKLTAYKLPLTIIVQPNGLPLYPQNQYLYSLLRNGKKSTATEAKALLAFQRFIIDQHKTYKLLTDDPEEGVVWLFADHLIDNLKEINPATGTVLKNPAGYSLSTARTYVDIVISFYKWLHTSGLFFITRDHKPFEFQEVTLYRHQSIDNHALLGHLNNKRKAIKVQTTDLKQRFPKIESTPPHLKLKPMTVEAKDTFIKHLKDNYNKGFKKTISLMFRLAIETGLRVEELTTFPASGVHFPMSDTQSLPFTIGIVNGCKTKKNKQRNIKIPYGLMLELNEYLNENNKKRVYLLEKGMKLMRLEHENNVEAQKYFNQKHRLVSDVKEEVFIESEHEHGRLFISANGLPYSISTIKSYMSKIRTEIRSYQPEWYYRVHDLRSTFATHWLKKQTEIRVLIFDLLMGELATLMGHESTKTTEKYINFMKHLPIQLGYAANKNKVAQDAVKWGKQ